MSFWILAAALTLVSILVLARALWHGHHAVGSRAARLAVYRDRLAELDAELIAGKIDASQHQEARRELEDAALDDIDDARAVAGDSGRPIGVLVFVAVVVPAIAFALYQSLGTHRLAPAPASELPALVAELDERLAQTPDDLQGWMLLGRSRVVLGDFTGAIDAWRNAQRISPEDPTVLANLGEALVLADGTQLTGEAAWLFDAAIDADPRNPKALWYGGLAAEARGDDALATERWHALLALDPPDVLRTVIERRLAAADPAAWRINIEVALGDGLDEPRPGATLFVTAHATDATSGAPLAAVRVPIGTWPMQLSLTEAAAMLPDVALSGRDALRIVARVSRSGTAERAPGDLIGRADWRRGEARVRILLDEVLE